MCAGVLLLAFLVPIMQIVVWAASVWRTDLDARYLQFIWHSVLLACCAAVLVVATALWLAWQRRMHADLVTGAMTRIATMGYAVPGMVLAVGIYIPVAWLDTQLAGLSIALGGTLLVMLLGLSSRFLAVGFGPLEAAFKRITESQENAARSLGLSARAVLWRLHMPLVSGGVLSAALLVFVDVMKEMPITLMTRPFGWDTLAVRIFEMTSEGMWEHAALPALFIVLVGLAPVIVLMREDHHE
jgi:iron(III) transport system permease protein